VAPAVVVVVAATGTEVEAPAVAEEAATVVTVGGGKAVTVGATEAVARTLEEGGYCTYTDRTKKKKKESLRRRKTGKLDVQSSFSLFSFVLTGTTGLAGSFDAE